MTEKQYQDLVHSTTPKSPILKDCIKAFIFGGGICCFGEVLKTLFETTKLNEDIAALYMKMCKEDLFNNIILQKIKDVTIISETEEFGETSQDAEIKLARNETNEGINEFIIGLEMYYKSPMSPPILFSVDFIIQIPIFDKAVGENLDVDEGNLDFNSLTSEKLLISSFL